MSSFLVMGILLRTPTFGTVHYALDEQEEGADAHLQQELVAVVQCDTQGEVPLQHAMLRPLGMRDRRCDLPSWRSDSITRTKQAAHVKIRVKDLQGAKRIVVS